jgi:hypothetical protein
MHARRFFYATAKRFIDHQQRSVDGFLQLVDMGFLAPDRGTSLTPSKRGQHGRSTAPKENTA